MWRTTIKGLLAHKVRLALTALAVVLGVGFVVGTYVLTDTINRAFDNLFQDIDRGVAVQVQSGKLLRNVVAIEALPIRFAVDGSRHGYASLEVGDVARITTRAITDSDELCHNEDIYYEPLASHLNHAMPAVATRASYSGNHLGSTWNESNRRSAFVGTFAL